MRARPAQEKIYELLELIYPGAAHMEWQSDRDATDLFENKGTYVPRPDITVYPINIHPDSNLRHKLLRMVDDDPLCKKLSAENALQFNKNPRCLLAVEVVFSGSSKHILGDFTNASMLGGVGLVVASEKMMPKVNRIKQYIDILKVLDKAPQQLFTNVACFTNTEFIHILNGVLSTNYSNPTSALAQSSAVKGRKSSAPRPHR